MHFHLPKPLHGWREFAGEVGIIVLGVLIALGAEQVIEAIHERNLAAEARANVRAEAGMDVGFIRDRLGTQGCIEKRLGELQAILSRPADGPAGPPPTWVSRPPVWPMFFGRWQAATASGRNSLFGAGEQGDFSILYAIFTRFDEEQAHEQTVWAHLRTLEWWNDPLGPQERLAFARDLQDAKYAAWDLNYAGTYAVRTGAQMHLPDRPPPAQLHAICLPLTTSRAEALKRLSGPFAEP
jgi:hypothetical protein